MRITEKKRMFAYDSYDSQGKYFFSSFILCKTNVHTISNLVEIIEGFRNGIIMLPNDTNLHISNALLSSRSKINLLSFKGVHYKVYHFKTLKAYDDEYLCITSYKMGNKTILKKLKAYASNIVLHNYKNC